MGVVQKPGHVVVCGVDDTALRTIEQLLAAGAEVVVVDAVAEAGAVAERLLEQWDVPLVRGRLREALAEARLPDAAAVVCLAADDLAALEAALLVRRLRPEVRLVVRMANPQVGHALAEVVGEGCVLDVAALAAPSVVEICLGRRAHELTLAGREFLVADLVVDGAATLRELYGELAPLVIAAGEAPPVVCPSRDVPVRPGDRVTAVGTLAQFAHQGVAEVVEHLRPQEPVRPVGARMPTQRAETGRAGMWALLRSLVAEADRPLRVAVILLGVVAVVSVLVLRLGYVKPDGSHMTLVDAAYFTVETIATVGYGDFNFAAQPTWLRVYAIGLMAGGAVLAAIVFAMVTQLLVSRRIERSFGQRRVGAMRGHVVVVGLGTVGIEVVEELVAAGRRVVVIDRAEAGRHYAKARALGVPVVVGDATEIDVLDAANLAGATAVAVLTSDDLVNVETGLVVRERLGARLAVGAGGVAGVRPRAGARRRGRASGSDYVRSTAALAAPWFVGAALGLGVLGTFYVDQTLFLVGRLSVTAGGGLDGLTLWELAGQVRVVALHRADGHLEHQLRRDTALAAGDEAYLVGRPDEVMQVLRRDVAASP